MDSTDLTPENLPLDPAEQRVADAVRGALGGRTPRPGLLAAVQARAARRHRRRAVGGAAGALALAGLVALVPLDVLHLSATEPPPAADVPPVRPVSERPSEPVLSAASVLTLDDVVAVLPATTAARPPEATDPDGPDGRALVPNPRTGVGACHEAGSTVLPAQERWSASWASDPDASDGFATSVEEDVIWYTDREFAMDYTIESRYWPSLCTGLPEAPVADGSVYDDLRLDDEGGHLVTVKTQALPGSESGWLVRAVSGAGALDGRTVVDISAEVEADTSSEAGALGAALLDAAVARAGGPPPPVKADRTPPPGVLGRSVDGSSFLRLDQFGELAPSVQGEAAEQLEPEDPPTGGYCGDAVLDGVPAADEAWREQWLGQQSAATGRSTEVTETVLHWGTTEGPAAYFQATLESPVQCGEPSDQAGYSVLPAPAIAGVPTVAVAGVEGTDGRWRVRAVGVVEDGSSVVDLTVILDAATADAAGARVSQLLVTALDQATAEAAP